MSHTICLFIAVALSADAEITSPESAFPDDPPPSVVSSFSAASPETLVLGQAQDAGWFEQLASGWTVEGGTIVLSRLKAKDAPLVVDALSIPLANASEFRFDHEAGWQVSACKDLGDLFAVEVRYFEIDGWEAAFNARRPTPGVGAFVPYLGGLALRGMSAAGVGAPVDTSLRTSTQLTNLEANARVRLTDRLTALVGYRHLEFHDRLTVVFDAAGGPNDAAKSTHDIRANNDLDGAQIGGQAVLLERDVLRLDGFAKAGVFHNRSANKLGAYPNAEFAALGASTSAKGAEKSVSSFVGEAGLTGTLQLTRSIALRAGYVCLWIDEIALSTDQANVNSLPINRFTPDITRVDAGGYQILQGGQFSIEFSY